MEITKCSGAASLRFTIRRAGEHKGNQRGKGPLCLAPEPNLGQRLAHERHRQRICRIDHRFSDSENMFVRYFANDGRLLNQSPLNDGFDLPSAFKDNFYRDQSLAGTLASVINPKLVNELRIAVCGSRLIPDGFDPAALGAVQHVHYRGQSRQS